jgi:D-sedoheptulose 7-phosphate isomerase
MSKLNIDDLRYKIIRLTEELDLDNINFLAGLFKKARQGNKRIFFIGNGGSASTASHLAADIGKNTPVKRGSRSKKRFRTVSLCDNISWITALGNDLSYKDIFVEQLKSLAQKGDLLIVISGSGNSPNILKTIKWAKRNGLFTFGLLGFDGGKAKRLVRKSWVINSNRYEVVESLHSIIHHLLVEKLKY